MLITVMAVGHCTVSAGREGRWSACPPRARKYGLEEAVRLEGSGVMRARRDAARPSGPLALPLTFSPPVRGHSMTTARNEDLKGLLIAARDQ
jgi:hypothetical protein